jgi:ribosomal protein S20
MTDDVREQYIKKLERRIHEQRKRIRFLENVETQTDKWLRRAVIQNRMGARYWSARIKQTNNKSKGQPC